jgi:Ca-activated chloride channel family protein
LTIDSASPISDVVSQLHPIEIRKNSATEMFVSLLKRATVPNKDFVVSWHVGARSLSSGYLAARDGNGDGYFTLMLMPPDHLNSAQIAPRELIFLVDCSGSQSGLPLQKAKDTLDYIIDRLNPSDTFQIMAFSNSVVTLFEKPEPAVKDTLARGHRFISGWPPPEDRVFHD